MLKARLTVQHELGLGKRPNAVPPDEVDISGQPRIVELGWHPVAGSAGKWFAEQTRLGKMITEEIHKSPDPTQHWAVLVGDYVHQLWMDEHLEIIYINEKLDREQWHTFEVGKTRFNDEALRQASKHYKAALPVVLLRFIPVTLGSLTHTCGNQAKWQSST